MTPDAWWQRRIACAQALLKETFRHGMGPMARVEARLAAALGDLLSRPGSMVRAVAAYLIGMEMGLVDEASRAVACGIEYLHTASLVFDDLPVMDDARVRRGAPCLHVVHGESVAMLAALALINRGYTMLWQGISRAAPTRQLEAAALVDERLGIAGVIGGQAFDLGGWRGNQSASDVCEVAARKTADLLRLTLVLPALIGRASRRELQLLDRLALLRGLAYQAADDIKDVLGAESSSGKSVGRDDAMGRPNLVAAEGLPAAKERFERLNAAARRVCSRLPGDSRRWGMLSLMEVSLPVDPTDRLGAIQAAV